VQRFVQRAHLAPHEFPSIPETVSGLLSARVELVAPTDVSLPFIDTLDTQVAGGLALRNDFVGGATSATGVIATHIRK
jgi:hypothetical protein